MNHLLPYHLKFLKGCVVSKNAKKLKYKNAAVCVKTQYRPLVKNVLTERAMYLISSK